MSKKFVAHGGILLVPPCQIARCRVVVSLWTKRSGGLDFSKPLLDIQSKRTKPTCPATAFFLSPSGGAGYDCILDKKKPIALRKNLVCYRLCVCASGSLITVILSCFTLISDSCLHLGQNNGKFRSSVSSLIFTLVLQLQKGHKIHSSIIIVF